MQSDDICEICSVERGAAQLQRCKICHKTFCGDCAYSAPSGRFCSRECGDIFFFGIDEEPSDEDGYDDHDD